MSHEAFLLNHPIHSAKCAFVFAHPGHELKLHAWLERLQPEVFLLTDGSGSVDQSRVAQSRQTISASGATLNPMSAAWTDHQAYTAILSCNSAKVIGVVEQLASELQKLAIEWVVCDSIEGFNPVHDLCTVLVANACTLVQKRTTTNIRCLDFPLHGPPDHKLVTGCDGLLELHLTSLEWQRKRLAIVNNTAISREMQHDFGLYGENAFKVEVLTPLDIASSLQSLAQAKPFYETHGENRVRAGVYTQVLRYQEHFLPLVEQVDTWVRSQ